MIDQPLTVGKAHRSVLLVGPRAVFVHGDPDAEADRLEGPVEEWVRDDAIGLGSERGADLEFRGVRFGRARCQEF